MSYPRDTHEILLGVAIRGTKDRHGEPAMIRVHVLGTQATLYLNPGEAQELANALNRAVDAVAGLEVP